MSTTDTQQSDTSRLLQLFAQVDEEGVGAPVLPIRWCVSPALIAELEDRQFIKPHLVIAVRHKVETPYSGTVCNQTWMYVVPLKRELQYVSFSRPGENEVRVVIVDLAGANAEKAVREIPTFDSDGVCLLRDYRVRYINDAVASLTVQVPLGMFAPEPKPWVKTFVGNFFDGRPFDQCHFRRRKILSFGLFAPLLLTAGMAIRIVAATFSLFLGRRDMVWQGLQPFNMIDIPWGDGKSIWRTDKYGSVNASRFPLWILNPMTLGLLPLLTYEVLNYVVAEHHGHSAKMFPLIGISWAHAYEYVDGALAALVVAILVVVGLIIGVAKIYTRLFGYQTAVSRRRNRRRDRDELHRQDELQKAQQLYADLRGMTCSQASSNATLSALPKEKQTVYLRFTALKASVCRPFAR